MSNAGQSTTSGGDFVIRYAELKGWVVRWEERAMQGLKDRETARLIAAVERTLSADLTREHDTLVDWERTKRSANRLSTTSIRFWLVQSPDMRESAYTLKRALESCIADPEVAEVLAGRRCRVGLEIDPRRRPMFAAGGKALGWLERQGVADDKFKREWNLFAVYAAKPDVGATPALGWSETPRDYWVSEEGLQILLPSMSGAEALTQLRRLF